MDGLIYGLCVFLDAILNPAILALGVLEAWILAVSWKKLVVLKAEIDRISGTASMRKTHSVRRERKKLKASYVTTVERDWNEFDQFCFRYQKDGKWFSAFSLIIQLFTLLGILGTVAGLFIAMRQNEDWSNAQGMYEGVKFALSTTVLGIILAVIFKAFDIYLNSWYINYIDDGIARFQSNYNEEKDYPQEEAPKGNFPEPAQKMTQTPKVSFPEPADVAAQETASVPPDKGGA
ncbi:MAG: MotA/TolQ/ExbB proton channel family protein [Lachnospiraceae bacterium]|nr:MotA/TolQ/ExbB proton channel family protein [Lachnospiraceae bacterium]